MNGREEFRQILTEHPELYPLVLDVILTFLYLADHSMEKLDKVFEEKRVQYGF